MKETFFKLDEQKRQMILKACLEEFSVNSYDHASINRIIHRAGISKGGLFKYIEDKRDLYLYTIGFVLEDLVRFQAGGKADDLCYFDRIRKWLAMGLEYYSDKEIRYRAVLNALADVNSPLHSDVLNMRRGLINKYMPEMLDGIDWSLYSRSRDEVMDVAACMIEGFNIRLLRRSDDIAEPEGLKRELSGELEVILEVLKKGLERGL